jgi:hypothetical protein
VFEESSYHDLSSSHTEAVNLIQIKDGDFLQYKLICAIQREAENSAVRVTPDRDLLLKFPDVISKPFSKSVFGKLIRKHI